MAIDYLPLLILLTVATGIAIVAMILPAVLGPKRSNKQKLQPYESGIIPFADARRPFPVKYYLVAMLFILFDIEVIFLYPWAVVSRDLCLNGFAAISVFVGVILIALGILYALSIIWVK